MKLKIIGLLFLSHVCLLSQTSTLKKVHESKIGIYYSTTDNKNLIFSLDSFLIEKLEKTFVLFKHELSKPLIFEFYPSEKEILFNCGNDTNQIQNIYERLACSKDNKIQITNLHSSTNTDSLYTKWGGFNKVVFHHYLHILLLEAFKSNLPKCFSEGIAVFYSQQLKFDKGIKEIILKKTETRYAPTVNELLSDKKISSFPNIYHWSFLFCKYIIDTYGWDRMLEILNSPEKFYKIMGRRKEVVDSEWNLYLIKKYPDN